MTQGEPVIHREERSDEEMILTEEMVLLTECCVERDCGRVRYSELTDDANTHWHVKRGVALKPVSALADLAAARAENERLSAEASDNCTGCERPTNSVDTFCFVCKLDDLEQDNDRQRLRADRAEAATAQIAAQFLARKGAADLIPALEALRRQLCPYPGATCDCKFGVSGMGEQTGCPELRQAIAALATTGEPGEETQR